MRAYKVIFENNTAVAAAPIDLTNEGSVDIEQVDGKDAIHWLVVYADSVEDSVEQANKTVHDYFGFMHLS